MIKRVFKYWYLVLIGSFFIVSLVVYACFGEESYIAVHDNLDLFVAQFQMMKNTESFFAHGVEVPFLGGISRDNLPSEFSLYTVLFMCLPSFAAYITGYFLKISIAMVSVWLLAEDWYGEKRKEYRSLVALLGFAYGALNMFPAFGIPFASIPLVIYLLRRIYKKPSVWLYIALFCYPFLSYFSYFGFFILAYLTIAVIWLAVRDKRLSKSLFLALFVLGAGYVAFEYRLFGVMLFNDTETIRATMTEADLTAGEVVRQIGDVWKNGVFHAESVHGKLVIPVCILYFIYLNGKYMKDKNWKGIFCDSYNLLMFVILFNSVIYGVYYWGSFRRLVETLLPPLKGFQFNRTVFFSPFLWYASFFVVLQRLSDCQGLPVLGKIKKKNVPKRLAAGLANGLALAAIAIILLTPGRYNDWYTTCKNKSLELLKGKVADDMSYGEFYSTELFEEIKADIGYDGEWAVAYGIHPAVLEYNDIATLDGYLGFYSQQYKEEFRKVIAPALERVEASRIYYDGWGARVYVYSGTDASVVSATKTMYVTDYDLYMDTEAFEELGGKYIFSRIGLENATELGLTLVKVYEQEKSPYVIYLYEK